MLNHEESQSIYKSLRTAEDVNLYLSSRKAVVISDRPKLFVFAIIGGVIITLAVLVPLYILKSQFLGLTISLTVLLVSLPLYLKLLQRIYLKDLRLRIWIKFCDERSIVYQSTDYVGLKLAIEGFITQQKDN